jgi:hypothetical protein
MVMDKKEKVDELLARIDDNSPCASCILRNMFLDILDELGVEE